MLLAVLLQLRSDPAYLTFVDISAGSLQTCHDHFGSLEQAFGVRSSPPLKEPSLGWAKLL